MKPTVQKLVYTVVAAAIIIIAVAVPQVEDAKELLFTLAGGLAGGSWMKRPGDQTAPK